MLKYDEDFLKEVGLNSLPLTQKQAFLSHVQNELEMRVGERMTEGITVDQLREFEGIMEGDEEILTRALKKIGKSYQEDEMMQRLLKQQDLTEPNGEVLSKYLSVKWVQENRPDYKEIVKEVTEELKGEIVASREKILLATM